MYIYIYVYFLSYRHMIFILVTISSFFILYIFSIFIIVAYSVIRASISNIEVIINNITIHFEKMFISFS